MFKKVVALLGATGLFLLALTVPEMGTELAGNGFIMVGLEKNVMGPYDLEEGHYTVWVESFYPGDDDREYFEATMYDTEGNVAEGSYIPGVRDAEIEGFDCQLLQAFDVPWDEEWTLEFEHWNPDGIDLNRSVAVFLLRQQEPSTTALMGAGIVLTTVGVPLAVHSRRGRQVDGAEDDPYGC